MNRVSLTMAASPVDPEGRAVFEKRSAKKSHGGHGAHGGHQEEPSDSGEMRRTGLMLGGMLLLVLIIGASLIFSGLI